MTATILVLNAASSSIELPLFAERGAEGGAELDAVSVGQVGAMCSVPRSGWTRSKTTGFGATGSGNRLRSRPSFGRSVADWQGN